MRPPVIEFGRWAPVTAGEYDRRAHRIVVNLGVVEAVCARFGLARDVVCGAIVAHERVHAAAGAGDREAEERRARAAAIATAGAHVVACVDAVLTESRS